MQKLNKLIFSVGLSVCVFLLAIILVGCSFEVENNFTSNSTGNGGSTENQQFSSNVSQGGLSSLIGSDVNSNNSNVSNITESGDVIINIDDIISGISSNTSTSNVSSGSVSNTVTSKPESTPSKKPTPTQKPNDEGWTGDYPIPKY